MSRAGSELDIEMWGLETQTAVFAKMKSVLEEIVSINCDVQCERLDRPDDPMAKLLLDRGRISNHVTVLALVAATLRNELPKLQEMYWAHLPFIRYSMGKQELRRLDEVLDVLLRAIADVDAVFDRKRNRIVLLDQRLAGKTDALAGEVLLTGPGSEVDRAILLVGCLMSSNAARIRTLSETTLEAYLVWRRADA